MKRFIDRRLLAVSGAVALAALCVAAISFSVSLKKERDLLRSQQKELLAAADEYRSLKRSVDTIEGRKSLSKAEGIAQAVDEVFRSVGLNQKVKSVKSAGTREKRFALEEEADITVEKVTMNEMINALYRLQNAPMILSIKRTSIRSSFDNPSLLNVTMTVALVKPK